jgi:hypothetical protein
VVEDDLALPVGGFKFAVLGALFGYLNFATINTELGVNFLLAFWAYALGLV